MKIVVEALEQLPKKTVIFNLVLRFEVVLQLEHRSIYKCVNLEYNTLVCWADGTNDPPTKRLMFQLLFFFHKILQNSLQKPFQFIFLLQK